MKHKTYVGVVVRFLLAGFLIITIGLSACTTETEEPLRMAVIPAEEAIVEMERYAPIVEYLEEQIGRDIEMVTCTDYAAVIISLRIGDCDMARLGPFSYLLAVEEAQVEIIVRGVKESTGKDAYHALIITNADSEIKTLEDIRGKTFAFTDVGSTSGYLIPQAMFKSVGIDPEEDIDVSFAGSHSTVIEVVVNARQIDAGACADNRLEDALEAGIVKESEIFIVAKSDPIPTSPTAVRAGLDPVLKEKIKDAYLAMPGEIAQNAPGKLSGYVEAHDSDYDFLREVAKVLGLDLTGMD